MHARVLQDSTASKSVLLFSQSRDLGTTRQRVPINLFNQSSAPKAAYRECRHANRPNIGRRKQGTNIRKPPCVCPPCHTAVMLTT